MVRSQGRDRRIELVIPTGAGASGASNINGFPLDTLLEEGVHVLAIANHVHRPLQHGFQLLFDPDQCEQIRIRQFDHDINVTLIAKLIVVQSSQDAQADDAELVAPVSLGISRAVAGCPCVS